MDPIYEAYQQSINEKYKPRYSDKDLAKWGDEQFGFSKSDLKDWIKTMSDEDRKAHEDEMQAWDWPTIEDAAKYAKYRKYLLSLIKKHKIKLDGKIEDYDNYDLMLKLEDAGISHK